MESEGKIEGLSEFLKENLIIIAFGVLGLIFLGYGLISLFSSSDQGNEIIFEAGEESSSTPSSNTNDEGQEIVIDIQGAVLRPGVYKLPYDSRLSDAINISEGLSSDADYDFVAKNMNMAAKLIDGAKIYIPKIGEEIEVVGLSNSVVGQNNSLININTASSEMLDSLPGVGPVTSQKIIDNRPYEKIEDLLTKKIVGNKVFEDISDKITIF